ncbi:MAG: M50 family metallopeptidase [Kiritimatiellaeota bacterium]|nr:M50 family metallopeptidase [Kiritimatiellota bacterium]
MLMTNRGFYLGTLFGIPIRAGSSVFILIAWIFLTFGSQVALAFFFALGLLFSIVWHELAHSLAAMAFGGKVRQITLQLMGGCAAISEMPRRAWQEWLMAAAGPASSFLLAGIAVVAGRFAHPRSMWAVVLYALMFMNVRLGFFNLLPAFPMDGGRILRATLQSSMSKAKATWIASRIGRFIAVVFVISGFLNLDMFQGAFLIPETGWLVLDFLISILNSGSWIKIIIGISIFQAAEMEYRMLLAEEAARRRGNNPWGFANPFAPPPPRPDWDTPPDDDRAIVSPPPYRRDRPDRVDIKRGE